MIRALKLLNPEDLRFLVLPVLCGLSVTFSLFLIYRSIHQVYQTDLFVLKDLSLGFLAIVFVTGGIYTERITAEKLAQRVVSRLRISIFQKVLNTSANDSALHERSSTFLRLTSDMSPVRNWIVHGLVNGIVLVTVLLSILVLLYFVHPFLALTGLGAFLLLVTCSIPLGRKLSQSSQEQRYQRTRLLDRVTAQLTSLPWILLFNQIKRERGRYHKSNSTLVDATLKRAHWSGLLRASSEAVMWGTFGALGLVGLSLVRNQLIAVHELVLILTSSIFLLHRFRNLYQVFSSWASIQPSLDRIETLMSRRNRHAGKKTPEFNTKSPLISLRSSDSVIEIYPQEVVLLESRASDETGRTPYPLNALGVEFLTLGNLEIERARWSALTRSLAFASARFSLREKTLRENLGYGYRARTQDELYECWQTFNTTLLGSESIDLESEDIDRMTIDQKFIISLVSALSREPQVLLLDLYGLENQCVTQDALISVSQTFSGAVLCFYRPYQRHWFDNLSYLIPDKIIRRDGVSI